MIVGKQVDEDAKRRGLRTALPESEALVSWMIRACSPAVGNRETLTSFCPGKGVVCITRAVRAGNI